MMEEGNGVKVEKREKCKRVRDKGREGGAAGKRGIGEEKEYKVTRARGTRAERRE